jgi:hypothetical protein
MRRIIRRTVCTAESTTESRCAVSHTFHNVVEKRNPYRSINRRRLPEPTPASLFSAVQYVISIKVCDGLIVVTAHACKTTT